jgi:hypothetical protein
MNRPMRCLAPSKRPQAARLARLRSGRVRSSRQGLSHRCPHWPRPWHRQRSRHARPEPRPTGGARARLGCEPATMSVADRQRGDSTAGLAGVRQSRCVRRCSIARAPTPWRAGRNTPRSNLPSSRSDRIRTSRRKKPDLRCRPLRLPRCPLRYPGRVRIEQGQAIRAPALPFPSTALTLAKQPKERHPVC